MRSQKLLDQDAQRLVDLQEEIDARTEDTMEFWERVEEHSSNIVADMASLDPSHAGSEMAKVLLRSAELMRRTAEVKVSMLERNR